jgi:hypothetical protein
MIVRANMVIVDGSVYEAKVERWASRWPLSTIVRW